MAPRIVLLHGIATTASIWVRVVEELAVLGLRDVLAIQRPCTGSLELELEAIGKATEDALVVGQSGGATLALALACSSENSLAGAVAHEPAVGSLVPALLAPVAAAFAARGVEGLGSTLYGPSWSIEMAGDLEVIPRELAMFRAFEPSRVRDGQGPVLVTVGAASPPARQQAAAALHTRLGYEVAPLEGASHFAAWNAPVPFAAAIAGHFKTLTP